MADMLKFRKGTYAQIQAATKVPGTIYIAKDEKAMYVDIDTSENGRIRIGDFIRVNTVENITPPYSTSALYYVEADNALLKYDGSNWKQVNGTDDLAERLDTTEEDIQSLKGTVGSATSGLVKDVNDLKTVVGKAAEGDNPATGLVADVAANASDIENLKKAVGMGDNGEVEGIGATVAQLAEDLDTLETEVHGTDGNGGMKATLSEHTGKISALEEASAKHAEKTYVDSTFAKAADVYNKTETYTKAEVDSAIDADVLVEKNRAITEEERLSGLISNAQGKANDAYTLAGEKATLADVAAVGYALATDVESDIEAAKQAAINDAATKYATIKTVETIDGKVSKNTSDIAKINTALESVVTKDELASKTYATTANVATAKEEAITAAAESAASLYATKEALNATNEAVSEAKDRADEAYSLAEGKTTAAEVKTQIEEYGYATTGYVDQAEADAVAAAKTAGDKAYAAKSIENTVASHTSDLTTLKGAATVAGSVAEAKKAGDDALALIGDANSGLTKTVNGHTTALEILNGADTVNGSVANAKKVGTEAATQAETNRQAIANLKGTVDKLDGDVNTDGSVKKQIKDAADALKSELSAEIDADIRAANAMEYVKTIESASELPTTAKNGATYVVGATFGNYAAGDMLIAQGTEDADTGLITNPTWAHVKSGYDASLDQKLTGADNKIKLSTGTGLAGTEVAFTATGSASVSVADNTVTIGMVWEDFE